MRGDRPRHPEWELFRVVQTVERTRVRNEILDWPVRRVIEVLHADPAGFPGISDACRQFRISPSHLRRIIRRHLGVSPSAYVRWVRITEAVRRMVLDPDKSLAALAGKVGYASQGSLSRLFRNEVGLEPRFVRAVIRAGPGGEVAGDWDRRASWSVHEAVAEVSFAYHKTLARVRRAERRERQRRACEDPEDREQITSIPRWVP